MAPRRSLVCKNGRDADGVETEKELRFEFEIDPQGRAMKHGTWIKMAVSIGLLTWFLAGVDLNQLRTHLAGIPAGEVLLVLLLYAAAWMINAAKWHVLLTGCLYRHLLALTMIGQFYAIVLPGQIAGEAVKAWRLIGRTVETAPAVASVLMDRMTGIVALLGIGLMGGMMTPNPAGFSWALVFSGFLAGIGLTAFVLRFGAGRIWMRNYLTAIGNRLPFAQRLTHTLISCIEAWIDYLKAPFRLLVAIGLGALFQLLAVLILARIAVSVGVQISFADWCWVFTAVSLLVLLPITIGGIGLREGGFLALLTGLGVSSEKALACSFALFGLQLLSAAVGAVLDFGMIAREKSGS